MSDKRRPDPHPVNDDLWTEMKQWQAKRLARRVVGPYTARGQDKRMQRFCDYVGPGVGLNDVTETMFESWLADLATTLSPYGRPYKPASINVMASPVRAFFNTMTRRGVIDVDPCIDVPRLREDPIEPRSLSTEVLDRLIAGCSGPTGFRDQTLIIVAALTGLRASELSQMRVELWDREQNLMPIRRSKTNRMQNIHFAPQVVDQLRVWVRFGLSGWLPTSIVGPPTHGPLWPGEKNDPDGLRPGSIGAIVRHVAEDAEVRANLHALRHTFIRNLFQQGVPANVVQGAAGHESLNTTGRYAKAHDGDVETAVRNQDRIGA